MLVWWIITSLDFVPANYLQLLLRIGMLFDV